ncbi:MAG: single-stranded DNA-binding protein [Aeromicrobium sp.]|uniref:single-stranded DNA-binding protein n=1 Tax=Aeromicrobium sp. TaxID=1871063 RepID=UPI0039E6F9A7
MNNSLPFAERGNLTGDPELSYLADGTARTRFTLAVDERKKQPDGSYKTVGKVFYRVACWANAANLVAELYRKGDPVVVVGDLRHRSYLDAEDKRRQSVDVTATIVCPDPSRSRFSVDRAPQGSSERPAAAAASEQPPGADPWAPASGVGGGWDGP